MIDNIRQFWKAHPLRSILFLGLIFRLIAAIFSTGFVMHDDHFLVIEPPSSWVLGGDYNRWLPWHQIKAEPSPEGHSFFYPGLHFIFFSMMKWLGIYDPKIQMLLVRLLHAVFSLFTISLSFKITQKLAGLKPAVIVGLAIAIGWAFPFFSVRNLVEMVCIPFYLYGIWLFVKHNYKDSWGLFFVMGILFGIAFSIRLQLAVFYLGFGASILIMGKWRGAIALVFGFGLGAFLTQGIIDYFIWDKPFAELIEYIRYNSGDDKYNYGGRWNWYKYLLVLSFFSIPIIGLFWLVGMLTQIKKYFWLWIPLVFFILFHTTYPNQQERFMFPVLPIFIILGVIGWEKIRNGRQFWIKRQKLWSTIQGIGWGINFLILLVMSTYSTKTAKVNSAYYFYDKPLGESTIILQDDSFGDDQWYEGKATAFPIFYSGTLDISSYNLNNINDRERFEKSTVVPDYLLLHGTKYLEERLTYYGSRYPNMAIEDTFYSSAVDRLLHYMNPRNKTEQVVLIKTNAAH